MLTSEMPVHPAFSVLVIASSFLAACGSGSTPTEASVAVADTDPTSAVDERGRWLTYQRVQVDLDADGVTDQITASCRGRAMAEAAADRLVFGGCDEHDQVRLAVNDHVLTLATSVRVGWNWNRAPQSRFALRIVDVTPQTADKQVVISIPCGDRCGSFGAAFTQVYLIRLQGGSLQELWSVGSHSGRLQWLDDGSWEETLVECRLSKKALEQFGDNADGHRPYGAGTQYFTERKLRWNGKRVVEAVGAPQKSLGVCEVIGRCPFVYASGELVGEILTNRLDEVSRGRDVISIPRRLLAGDELIVRIAEEKPGETTYLDTVWLEVGGQPIFPARCRQGDTYAFCRQDQVMRSLATGDELTLVFKGVPAQGEIRLVAHGYYTLRGVRFITQDHASP